LSSPAIETFELTKRFPKGGRLRALIRRRPPPAPVTAVDHVSLTIERGELFGLLGPNGAGKTTLIKLLCTLIVPTSGSARVDGHDLHHEGAIKARVGLVTGDERSFYWRLSGRRNLLFFAALHGMHGTEARRRVDEVLELMELEEIADRPFQTYSTGMRQRLAIARGLLNHPRILFLDEPTRSLDPTATAHLHAFIRDELVGRQGVTVLLATHRLSEAERLCDRVAVMHRGRIRACGTISELRRTLKRGDRYRFHVQELKPQVQDELRELVDGLRLTQLGEGETLVEFDLTDRRLDRVIDVIRVAGGRIVSITSEPVPLEEVFAHLTAQEQEEGD